MERASCKPPGRKGRRSGIRAGRTPLSPKQVRAYYGIDETLSVASLTLNDVTIKTALERSVLAEVAQPDQVATPDGHTAERSVTQNLDAHTRPDSGGSQDFNPVTDKAPLINMEVSCSFFDASRRPSDSSADATPSTQNEHASRDSSGLEDFNPVKDTAPPISMDVNCSAFDATRWRSRSTLDTAPSTQCGDESTHHAEDEQERADSVPDHGLAQAARRVTAAANMRQSGAYPPSRDDHTRPDSGGSQDFNPVKDKAPPIEFNVTCSFFDASRRPSGSTLETAPSTQNEHARPDSGGLEDFNPVKDRTPPLNMDVNCSAFNDTRRPSRSTFETAPSTQNEHASRDSGDLEDFNPVKDKTPPLNMDVNCSAFNDTRRPSRSTLETAPSTQNEHASRDSSGLEDFNPVKDTAPPISMDVNCSAFDATRRHSRFVVDTASSAQCDDESVHHTQDEQEQRSVDDLGPADAARRGTDAAKMRQSAAYTPFAQGHDLPQNSTNEHASPDRGGLKDFSPVKDNTPPVNMDVNCSALDATRGPSRSTFDMAPTTRCGDESAHHAEDEQYHADSVADHEPVQAAERGTAAAKKRQSVAYPPFSQGHDLPQNSKLSQVESKTAQVRKSYAVGAGGHSRCSVFAHRQQRFEDRTPSPNSLTKNSIPLRSALRPSHIVSFKKPGQIVGAEDKIPGPHRNLRLAKNSIALRNIADDYDSNSSSNGGAPVRKTVSLQDTRADRGYVKSPGQNAVTVDDDRLNILRKKSKRKSVGLQRVVLQRNLQATSLFKSPIPSAGSSALMDLSTISKSGFTNRTRKPVFPPQAMREKGKPKLRFDNDSSFEESSSEGDSVERTLPQRQTDDSLGTSRSLPRIVGYAETTVDSVDFTNTSSSDGQTSGRSTTHSHNEIEHGRHRTNDHLRELDHSAPSQRLMRDDDDDFDFGGASPITDAGTRRDSDWGDMPASQNKLGGYLRALGNSPGATADFNDAGPSPAIPRQRRSSLDHSLFTTGGSDTSGMCDTPGNISSLNHTSTPLRAPLSSLPRRLRSLSPSLGSRDSGVSAASSSSPVHVVAKRGRPEQIKVLTPKIRDYALRKDNVFNAGKSDVPAQTENGVLLRRSTRNRVPRLNHHLGQRARYQTDDSGNLDLVSVTSIVVKEPMLAKARTLNPAEAVDKIKKNGAKRAQVKKNDKPAPKKKRGLDLDVTVEDD